MRCHILNDSQYIYIWIHILLKLYSFFCLFIHFGGVGAWKCQATPVKVRSPSVETGSLFSLSPPQIFNTQAWHQCSYSLSHLTVPNFTFEPESYYVAQVNFEFMNFLPPPPKSGNTGVRCPTQSWPLVWSHSVKHHLSGSGRVQNVEIVSCPPLFLKQSWKGS